RASLRAGTRNANRYSSPAPGAVDGPATGRLTNHSRTAWVNMATMPRVAIQSNVCGVTRVSPAPKAHGDGEHPKQQYREGVQAEGRAYDGHQIHGDCQHIYPFNTAQGLTNR